MEKKDKEKVEKLVDEIAELSVDITELLAEFDNEED